MLVRRPLRSADGETAQVAAAVAPAAQAPAPAAAPKVDEEAIKASAQKALLEALGIKDIDEAKTALEAVRKAEESRLSEAEKQAKALKQSLEEKSKAEAEAAAAKAEIKAMKAAAEMRDKLDGFGVAPSARVMVEALYSASKQAKDFDEAKFFEKIRADHPTLFGAATATVAPANTSPAPVTGTVAQAAPPKLVSALESRPWAAQYARSS